MYRSYSTKNIDTSDILGLRNKDGIPTFTIAFIRLKRPALQRASLFAQKCYLFIVYM